MARCGRKSDMRCSRETSSVTITDPGPTSWRNLRVLLDSCAPPDLNPVRSMCPLSKQRAINLTTTSLRGGKPAYLIARNPSLTAGSFGPEAPDSLEQCTDVLAVTASNVAANYTCEATTAERTWSRKTHAISWCGRACGDTGARRRKGLALRAAFEQPLQRTPSQVRRVAFARPGLPLFPSAIFLIQE